MSKLTKKIREAIEGDVPAHDPPITAADLLSTGSTLLNLACTGRPNGGFIRGRYTLVVGDSDSGKTWISLTCLAEAANDKRFDDYALIHDDVEGGALMDVGRYFGRKAAARIESPLRDKEGNSLNSVTVEDFYDRVDELQDEGRPFIYVLDSMDALSSRAEQKTVKKQKRARNKGEEETGSYGDGKAKINSARIRTVVNRLRESGSILIVISQTRDNIGFTSRFEPQVFSGGKALKFYARLQLWAKQARKIKKDVKGKNRELGIVSQVRVRKNSVTGRKRTVEVPILYSSGIDDVGANIDFLVEEEAWKKKKGGVVVAPEFEFEGTREKLVRHIENEGLEKRLRTLVTATWNEIENASELKRKKKYE